MPTDTGTVANHHMGRCYGEYNSTPLGLIGDVSINVNRTVNFTSVAKYGSAKIDAEEGGVDPSGTILLQEHTLANLAMAAGGTVASGMLKLGGTAAGTNIAGAALILCPVDTTGPTVTIPACVFTTPDAIPYGNGKAQEYTAAFVGKYDATSDSTIYFTAATAADATAPTFTSTPADDATGVALSTTIELVFNEQIQTGLLDSSHLILRSVTSDAILTATITNSLQDATHHRVWINPGANFTTAHNIELVVVGIKNMTGLAVTPTVKTFTVV